MKTDSHRHMFPDPCLNQSQIFSKLEHYVHMDDAERTSIDTIQFVALIHLILALLAILGDSAPAVDDRIPGWARFEQASHLLAHAMWLSDGNLTTIQTMVIKCTFLLYAEKFNSAYETIGQAVRLCYLTGLHNQKVDDDCSPFESHMRQRIFWSVYCLERNVSQVCGVPYLIRDSEVCVPLPAALDDRALGVTEQVPEESSRTSCIPYLHITSKWASLSSQIWDQVFRVNAQRPVDEEFVVTMDARIENLRARLPSQLIWHQSMTEVTADNGGQDPMLADGIDTLPFVRRQAMIFHLVSFMES